MQQAPGPAANAESSNSAVTPAYIPFSTFETVVDRMASIVLPKQLDRTFLKTFSGTEQTKIFQAFRFLGLIDADNRPTEMLRALVGKPDERSSLLGEIIHEHYSWALHLGLDATEQELLDAFREHGNNIDGETRRKAITFFIKAADAANIQVSKLWRSRPGRPTGRSTPARRASTRRRRAPSRQTDETPGTGVSDTQPLGAAERRDYFRLLTSLAEKSETPDADILDRIERLLGVRPAEVPASPAPD